MGWPGCSARALVGVFPRRGDIATPGGQVRQRSPGQGVVRIEGHRLQVGFHGLGAFAQPLQHPPTIEPPRLKIGVQRQGLIVALQRFFRTIQPRQAKAAAVENGEVLWRQDMGSAQVGQGLFEAAGLLVIERSKVQKKRMFQPPRQSLIGKMFGARHVLGPQRGGYGLQRLGQRTCCGRRRIAGHPCSDDPGVRRDHSRTSLSTVAGPESPALARSRSDATGPPLRNRGRGRPGCCWAWRWRGCGPSRRNPSNFRSSRPRGSHRAPGWSSRNPPPGLRSG